MRAEIRNLELVISAPVTGSSGKVPAQLHIIAFLHSKIGLSGKIPTATVYLELAIAEVFDNLGVLLFSLRELRCVPGFVERVVSP